MAGAVKSLSVAAIALALATGGAQAQSRIKAGTLVCKGEGGWGAIITSKKEFDCTYTSADGTPRGRYKGVIRKYGLDIGKTGSTTLGWLVLGAEGKVGGQWVPGSLAGKYRGVGAEVSVGVGFGANALVGADRDAFVLQPLSVQVQSGVGLAAGVESFSLRYVGPPS